MGQQALEAAHNPIRKHVRGSALLLGGRGCSLFLNLVTQVIIVRALSKTDYGALGYVLSLMELFSIGLLIALDKTVLRFGAVYYAQKDYPRFAGSLVLALSVPALLGLALNSILVLGGSTLAQALSLDSTSWPLMVVIAFLVPANGIASVTLSFMTVVQGARAVFIRKHLLSPGIKLVTVVTVVVMGAGVFQLSIGLLIAGLCGLALDVWFISRMIISEKLFKYFSPQRILLPVREFIVYGFPVLLTDLIFMGQGAALIALVGWLGTTDDTASLRAIFPLVKLNELVLLSFTTLFVPLASRLVAKENFRELWAIHHQTNLWVMSLSFPVFAASVALAYPLTVLILGSEYADASVLLIILATGYFLQTWFGLSGDLARILGSVRLLLAADVVSGIVLLVGAYLLIQRWEAIGAATAAAVGGALHTYLRWLVLRHVADVNPAPENRRAILVILVLAGIVSCSSIYWVPGWVNGGLLAVSASLIVLLVVRKRLDIDNSFPELRKIPFSGWLLPPHSVVTASDSCPADSEAFTPSVSSMDCCHEKEARDSSPTRTVDDN